MKILTKKQIISLHEDLIQTSGGIKGIRDEGLLESAVQMPFQSFENIDLYPSIQQKAARLAFGLVKNHAFLDGNKRIGAHAMLIFLIINDIELNYTQKELADVFLGLADGSVSEKDLLNWILSHEE